LAGGLTADRRQRRVGQIGGEEDVVRADRAAQQLERAAAHTEPEPRQEPRIVVEQAVALAGDVAERVGHDKCVALFEGEQPCGGP
jgi:hypothetical protein